MAASILGSEGGATGGKEAVGELEGDEEGVGEEMGGREEKEVVGVYRGRRI